MNYKRFKELVRGKEKRTVDFKLESYVFKIKSLKLKGELAKDICAMANNGNVASYIIFGVSDDGLSFKSVNNEKLTDNNIQTFCKKAISPIPKVKLNRECWKNADFAFMKAFLKVAHLDAQYREITLQGGSNANWLKIRHFHFYKKPF